MKWLFENKFIVLIVGVTLAFLIFMAQNTGEGAKANWGKDGLNIVLAPFETMWTNAANSVQGFFAHFSDLEEVQKRNSELETRLAELESQTREIDSLKKENDRLLDLLNLKDNMRAKQTVAAQVIAKDASNWNTVFKINKGEKDGIVLKQAVITNKGLVGYVSEVGTNWAQVTTIINSGTAVGSVIVRTQDTAVVEGDFTLQKDGLCKMLYISKDANIVAGDSIETSGLGGVYPKGILVGIIREINIDKQTVSQSAIIEPAVDFDRVSEVLVVL